MALTVSTMRIQAAGQQTKTIAGSPASFNFDIGANYALTDGTTAGKADRLFTDTRTLGASATENLDLAAALTDAYGASLTFVTIKAVIIVAAAGNTNNVEITRPATNGVALFMAASDGIALKPGYGFAWMGSGIGVTVTAGTGDLITVTNSGAGTSVTYTVCIIGTSA